MSLKDIPRDDWDNVQKVILFFHCQAGKGSDLLDILSAALVETRDYDGCVSVSAFVDADP